MVDIWDGPPREGTRGGLEQFSFESIKGQSLNDRECYLGHSLKVGTVGRMGRFDRHDWWYLKRGALENDKLAEEVNVVQRFEEELRKEALGIKPQRLLLIKEQLSEEQKRELLKSSEEATETDDISSKALENGDLETPFIKPEKTHKAKRSKTKRTRSKTRYELDDKVKVSDGDLDSASRRAPPRKARKSSERNPGSPPKRARKFSDGNLDSPSRRAPPRKARKSSERNPSSPPKRARKFSDGDLDSALRRAPPRDARKSSERNIDSSRKAMKFGDGNLYSQSKRALQPHSDDRVSNSREQTSQRETLRNEKTSRLYGTSSRSTSNGRRHREKHGLDTFQRSKRDYQKNAISDNCNDETLVNNHGYKTNRKDYCEYRKEDRHDRSYRFEKDDRSSGYKSGRNEDGRKR